MINQQNQNVDQSMEVYYNGPRIQRGQQEQRVQDESILDYSSSLFTPQCKLQSQRVEKQLKQKPIISRFRQKSGIANIFIKLFNRTTLVERFGGKLLQLSQIMRYKNLKVSDLQLLDNLSYQGLTKTQLQETRNLHLTINPGSITSILWKLVQNFLLLVLLFVLPFSYAFQVNVEQILNNGIPETVFILIVELGMIIDMLVHCNTGYMYQGEIVKNHIAVLKHYVKQDLIYDAVSFISLQIPLIWSESVSAYVFITATVLFFCLKISIVQKSFTQFRDFLNLTEMQNLYLDLLILIFKVTIVAHIFACVWHASAQFNLYNRNWLISNQIDQESIWVRYNYSFYWASATMITVGYGDIAPTNDWERLVANFTMYIGCGVFAFSLNGIGLILSDMNKANEHYRRIMSSMNQYMKKQNIRYALQNKIRSYIEYQMKDNQQNDSDVQFGCDLLSESLKNQLQEEARQPVLKQLKWIDQFSNEFKHKIILKLEEIKYSPGDYILKQDEIDDSSLYILQDGIVDIKFGNLVLHSLTPNTTLGSKNNSVCSTFGEFGFFTNQARTCSVTSNGYSKLLKLKRSDFTKALTKQSDIEIFYHTRKRVEQNDFTTCHLKCYSCRGSHLIKNCPNHHLVLDKEAIIKRSQFPVEQERDLIIRKGRHNNTLILASQLEDRAKLLQRNFKTTSLQEIYFPKESRQSESQNSQENWLLPPKQYDEMDQSPKKAPIASSKNVIPDSNTHLKLKTKDDTTQSGLQPNFYCLNQLDKAFISKQNVQFNLENVIKQLEKQRQKLRNDNKKLNKIETNVYTYKNSKSIYSHYTFDAVGIQMIHNYESK